MICWIRGWRLAYLESFVILEIVKLSHYKEKNWQFSYLLTKDDVEIDLIIERPGKKRALIEIKSKSKVTPSDLRHLRTLGSDISNSEQFCLSNDPHEQIMEGVACLPFKKGFQEIGL